MQQSFVPINVENRSSRNSFASSYLANPSTYRDLENQSYAPTYTNLLRGSSSAVSTSSDIGQQLQDQGTDFDLSAELAQYGLTPDSIPF